MKQIASKRSFLPFFLAAVAAETAAIIAYARVIRPWFLHWGATPQEVDRVMPGDDLVAAPRSGYTRAITIHAPVQQVWQWVVQIGQNRGGLYADEWLERIFGAGAPNAEQVLPQFQNIRVGDYMLLYPNGPGYAVARVNPPHSLVLCTIDYDTGEFTRSVARDGVHGTFAFLLEPYADSRTRLVVRMRLDYEPRPLYKALWGIEEPVTFLMERQMLRGIKDRAETHRVPDALLDQILPTYEFRGLESIVIHATPEEIFSSLSETTGEDLPLADMLEQLRYLPARMSGDALTAPAINDKPLVLGALEMGFVGLGEKLNRQVVIGAIGRFHDLMNQEFVRVPDADGFRRYDGADMQKLVISFRVTGDNAAQGYTLTLEHRTHALSESARQEFSHYWLAIKPARVVVAQQFLHAVKRRAEAAARANRMPTPTRPQTPTLKPEFMGA
jgi:hypothetical protein